MPKPPRCEAVECHCQAQNPKHEPKKLEVSKELPTGLTLSGSAHNVVPLQVAAFRHHGPVKDEGSLVEPEALEGDCAPTAEVGSKALREEGASQYRGNAEANKENKQEVIVALKALVGSRVEVEKQVL